MLARAQGSILEELGYGQPRSDVMDKARKHSRWGWSMFGLGIVLQLVALALYPDWSSLRHPRRFVYPPSTRTSPQGAVGAATSG